MLITTTAKRNDLRCSHAGQTERKEDHLQVSRTGAFWCGRRALLAQEEGEAYRLFSYPEHPRWAGILDSHPNPRLYAVARYGEVELRSAADRSLIRRLAGHKGSVNDLAF